MLLLPLLLPPLMLLLPAAAAPPDPPYQADKLTHGLDGDDVKKESMATLALYRWLENFVQVRAMWQMGRIVANLKGCGKWESLWLMGRVVASGKGCGLSV